MKRLRPRNPVGPGLSLPLCGVLGYLPLMASASRADNSSDPTPSGSAVREELLNARVLILAALLGSIALLAYPPLNTWAAQFSDRVMAPYRRPPPTDQGQWQPGAEALVDITVVTADVWRLACASDQIVDGAHCTHKADKTPWPRAENEPLDDNLKNVIQPYRTENGNLLITVSGLWAQPAIASRVHREPPKIVQTKRQKRFTARCTVKFTGYLENAKLQWNQGAQWYDQDKVIVARAEHCEEKRDE